MNYTTRHKEIQAFFPVCVLFYNKTEKGSIDEYALFLRYFLDPILSPSIHPIKNYNTSIVQNLFITKSTGEKSNIDEYFKIYSLLSW